MGAHAGRKGLRKWSDAPPGEPHEPNIVSDRHTRERTHFHRGCASHKSWSLGGFLKTAEASAAEGLAQPLGSVVRESASATSLCSDGRWPTSKAQRRRDCLQDTSRATASNTPLPLSASELERAAVLSPRTATRSCTKWSPQVHSARRSVANSQNV